ncbi:unnamed protein product [Adineta steineri]|uniref:Uncharacterized protein n=1 Tax=Adineta steineri TaxID=433720 RepID=A0A819BBU6_9BILA|nr:unnamed protein product [Adineta steineri]CAF1314072.1 unnamed protein product [Adineta steineri]CAF3651358.1 unnamed protein product [Adineta steineri]CAF3795745.1 unnamed protein product [Adineta steineri]
MCDTLLIEAIYDGFHRALFPCSVSITLSGTKWPCCARCSSLILPDLIPKNENNSSKYLLNLFYNLNTFLNRIPSPKANIQLIQQTIESKSQVLYYSLEKSLITIEVNYFLHRWEHDNVPDTFFLLFLYYMKYIH